MNKEENTRICQAVDCQNESVDDMRIFCQAHWEKIPADARAAIKNAYDLDTKSRKHLDWVHQVRKAVAYLMGTERGLTRNKEKKNLDDFPKGDPFVKPSHLDNSGTTLNTNFETDEGD